MIHIAKELLQEIKLMEIIRKTYREMEWEITPKKIPDMRIDEWGSEIIDKYDRSKDIMNFELELKNIDREDKHILRCNIDNGLIEYKCNSFDRVKNILRFNLNNSFYWIFNGIYYEALSKYLKKNYQEIEFDEDFLDFDDFDDYISLEEQDKIHKLSYFYAVKEIAYKMVDAVEVLYKTEGKIIKIYAGDKLLIKRDEKNEKSVTDDDIKAIVMEELEFVSNIKIIP